MKNETLSQDQLNLLAALKRIGRAGSDVELELETHRIGQRKEIEETLEALSKSGLIEIYPSRFGKIYALTYRGLRVDVSGSA